ncbi:MAG: lytic transglycosylase domain-containing protein [Myxococcaceae bacterium]|nr:lytic transglycosylase domain-containing protein [Myxococcaceae bacterium]MCA3014459.1 lytic transglycosylase domain-containing protein [Myxococcaceae bacterium]
MRVKGWVWPLLVAAALGAASARAEDGGVEAEAPAALVANPFFPPPSSPEAPAAPPSPSARVERRDLASYFSSGRLKEARQAFAEGAYARARQRLTGADETPPARFLRALAAFRLRDFAAAGPEFEALADDYPALKPRCLVHAGWAFEGRADFEAAERVFGRVDPRSRLFADAQLGLARALRYRKGAGPAIEVLARLAQRPAPPWGRDVGAEALLALAELHAALGDAKAEQAALVELWSKHPLSAQALKHQARVASPEKLPPAIVVTRAEQLVEFHRNAQGLAAVEPLLEALALPDALACRAHLTAGRAHRKLRSHARAVAVLAPVARRCTDPDVRAKALYTLGFSQTVVAPEAAVATYEALALEFPDHPLADDALFHAAEARQRSGDLSGATDRLAELADRFPLSDMGADGLFKLFWLRRAGGDHPGSLEVLDEIEVRFGAVDEPHEVERARFWRARALEALGRRDEAVALLAQNATNHPATYYGLLSRERVEQLTPARGTALERAVAAATRVDDVFPLEAGPVATDVQFQSAVELLRLGFGELVPMELLAVDRAKAPPDVHRLLVLMLAMAGEERPAHGMARLWLRRDLSGPITRRNRLLWEIAFPKAYRDLVEASADEADALDPDLLQAIMREESALDPKALSWAGALGLCQLMPYTAAEVAAKLKLPRPSTAALLEPELNVRLGARYLADLVARFDGVHPFAVASYNAGPGAVNRWRRELPQDDLAAFVEQIPLQETRQYVKRVLRTYNTYKLLYSPGELARTAAPQGKPKPRKPEKKA